MRDIFLHHSGSLGRDRYASTAHLSVRDIDEYHKRRWNMKSSLGYYAGYNVIYYTAFRDFIQMRALGEETMAQRGYNHEFSLCIIGNHSKTPIGSPKGSVDELTDQTRTDVAEYLFDLINGNKRGLIVAPNTQLNFSITRIFPHRKVSNTECYGSFLDDSIFKADLTNLYAKKIGLLKKLVELYVIVFGLLQRRDSMLGSSDQKECDGLIEL